MGCQNPKWYLLTAYGQHQKQQCELCLIMQNRAKSSESRLAKSIWFWAMARNIWISVSADQVSRDLQFTIRMDTEPFYISTKFCMFQVTGNCFIFKQDYCFPAYVSWKPDPIAKFIDAFTLDRQHLSFYVFPPFVSFLDVCKR